jgi:phospholipase/lecithinase/hemolysin
MRPLSLALVTAFTLTPALAQAAPFSSLYVFGDSLSDTGNLSALAAATIPGLVVPGAPYETGRASDGPVAVEVMAAQLGLTAQAVASGGTNYAVIGAATGEVPNPLGTPGPTADNYAEVLLNVNLPVSTGLVSQVGLFVSQQVGPIDPNALFFIWAGTNDFFINDQDPSTVIPTAVGRIAGSITALAALGAREFFVPNLPDLSLTPGGGAVLQDQTMTFNAALALQLTQLETQLGVNILGFDTDALFDAILLNPSAYGLTNVTQPCYTGPPLAVFPGGQACATPGSYLFWDGSHPTARGHELLGLAFAEAIRAEAVPEPGVLVLTALGLAAWRRRRAA